MGAGGYQRSGQEFEPRRLLLRSPSGEPVRVEQRPRPGRGTAAGFRANQLPRLSRDGTGREDGPGPDAVPLPASGLKNDRTASPPLSCRFYGASSLAAGVDE